MIRSYPFFLLMIISIPLLWGLNVYQANKCSKFRAELRRNETRQENFIKDHKAITAEIRQLLSVENIEAVARNIGLQKVKPENIELIILGGKEFGH